MDFSLTPEQLSLQSDVTAFAGRELATALPEDDREHSFPRDAWRACAAFGIQGLPVPQAYGGRGENILSTVVALESLGYGCRDNGLLFALNAQMWSIEMPLVHFGTTAQKEFYLPKLVSGQWLGVHAVTEENAGSDAFSMRTQATPVPGGFMLSGSKLFITNAPVADVILVFARLANIDDFSGVSAFLVHTNTPDFRLTRTIEKMGLGSAMMGEFVLDDCFVPTDRLLGKPGAGLAIFNSSSTYERSCLFAATVGAMQRQLEECTRYARSRVQFGQAIGKFQSVANRIADMSMRLEIARLLVYKSAWLKDRGKNALANAAYAKIAASEFWLQSSLDAMYIHGARGYLSGADTERDLRDAAAGPIYGGTSDIQRVIIARSLGL